MRKNKQKDYILIDILTKRKRLFIDGSLDSIILLPKYLKPSVQGTWIESSAPPDHPDYISDQSSYKIID